MPSSRGLVNAGQVLGDAARVAATGTYEPVEQECAGTSSSGSSGTLPQLVRATITQGALHVGGLRIPLPIRCAQRSAYMLLSPRLPFTF